MQETDNINALESTQNAELLEITKETEVLVSSFLTTPLILKFFYASKAEKKIIACIGANMMREFHVSDISKKTDMSTQQIRGILKSLDKNNIVVEKVNWVDKRHADKKRFDRQPDKRKDVIYITQAWINIPLISKFMRRIHSEDKKKEIE